MTKTENIKTSRRSIQAEARESRERARAMVLAEEDNVMFTEELREVLKTRFGLELKAFEGKSASILPSYTLVKGGRVLAMADILYGKLEDYIKIPGSRFKNGTFCTEIFGVSNEDPTKCGEMKYCIFLLSKGEFWRWTFNKKKLKPYPTLTDEKHGIVVAIKREEFDPV